MDNDNKHDSEAGPSNPTNKITRTRISARAGLTFPVSIIDRWFRQGDYSDGPYYKTTAIYMTAVLEYLITEVIQFAGMKANESQRKTILPDDVVAGIQEDESLCTLFGEHGRMQITEADDTGSPPTVLPPTSEINTNGPHLAKTPTRAMVREHNL
ncbi:histone-fold-containing protein [Chlamydoabsidia padenii]|nr:histone-fold-containing protein [Chlamydoabsidia padenii]